MLISLMKVVSEMCSNVLVRFLFVQLKFRLHFQVTTMSGAAAINEIEKSRHLHRTVEDFLESGNLFLFPTSLNLYNVIFLNTEVPCKFHHDHNKHCIIFS